MRWSGDYSSEGRNTGVPARSARQSTKSIHTPQAIQRSTQSRLDQLIDEISSRAPSQVTHDEQSYPDPDLLRLKDVTKKKQKRSLTKGGPTQSLVTGEPNEEDETRPERQALVDCLVRLVTVTRKCNVDELDADHILNLPDQQVIEYIRSMVETLLLRVTNYRRNADGASKKGGGTMAGEEQRAYEESLIYLEAQVRRMISNEMRLKLYIDAIQDENLDEIKKYKAEVETKNRLIEKLNLKITEKDQLQQTLDLQLKELNQKYNQHQTELADFKSHINQTSSQHNFTIGSKNMTYIAETKNGWTQTKPLEFGPLKNPPKNSDFNDIQVVDENQHRQSNGFQKHSDMGRTSNSQEAKHQSKHSKERSFSSQRQNQQTQEQIVNQTQQRINKQQQKKPIKQRPSYVTNIQSQINQITQLHAHSNQSNSMAQLTSYLQQNQNSNHKAINRLAQRTQETQKSVQDFRTRNSREVNVSSQTADLGKNPINQNNLNIHQQHQQQRHQKSPDEVIYTVNLTNNNTGLNSNQQQTMVNSTNVSSSRINHRNASTGSNQNNVYLSQNNNTIPGINKQKQNAQIKTGNTKAGGMSYSKFDGLPYPQHNSNASSKQQLKLISSHLNTNGANLVNTTQNNQLRRLNSNVVPNQNANVSQPTVAILPGQLQHNGTHHSRSLSNQRGGTTIAPQIAGIKTVQDNSIANTIAKNSYRANIETTNNANSLKKPNVRRITVYNDDNSNNNVNNSSFDQINNSNQHHSRDDDHQKNIGNSSQNLERGGSRGSAYRDRSKGSTGEYSNGNNERSKIAGKVRLPGGAGVLGTNTVNQIKNNTQAQLNQQIQRDSNGNGQGSDQNFPHIQLNIVNSSPNIIFQK